MVRKFRRRLAIGVWVVALAVAPPPVMANLPALCDRAAQEASRATGVPENVLRAITRTETGRAKGGALQPWPWTVNMEGDGHWFDDRDAAKAFVFKRFKQGARSFDVGCFQVNYKWHGHAFASIEEMFDPQRNADYAARFLLRLYQELGSWTAAAGAYHSRTPEYANKYLARYEEIYADLGPAPASPPNGGARDPFVARGAPMRLPSSGRARGGSLVPLGDGGGGPGLLRAARPLTEG